MHPVGSFVVKIWKLVKPGKFPNQPTDADQFADFCRKLKNAPPGHPIGNDIRILMKERPLEQLARGTVIDANGVPNKKGNYVNVYWNAVQQGPQEIVAMRQRIEAEGVPSANGPTPPQGQQGYQQPGFQQVYQQHHGHPQQQQQHGPPQHGYQQQQQQQQSYPPQQVYQQPVNGAPPSTATQGAPQAMDAASFGQLKQRLSRGFGSDKVNEVRLCLKGSAWFSAAQVREMLEAVTFDSEQCECAIALYPHVVDKQNFGQALEAIKFSSTKEKIIKAIK